MRVWRPDAARRISGEVDQLVAGGDGRGSAVPTAGDSAPPSVSLQENAMAAQA
jgi:hypothetical protein